MGPGILISVDKAPDETLTSQVSSVEVYERLDQATTYKIRFAVDIRDNDIGRDLEGYTDPGSVLGVITEVNDQRVCLVNGPVIRQQVHLLHGGAGSWVEVEGTDDAQGMDQRFRNRVWSDVSDADVVSAIIGEYGMGNRVEATPGSGHAEDNHVLVQVESDLGLVRRLARRNGYHFWITYSPEGEATAHFGPRSLEGEPAAELIMNARDNNIEHLHIHWDARRPTEAEGRQVDLRTKEVMGGAVTLDNETALGARALAQITGSNAHSMQLAPPADDGGTMQARGRAALRDAQWFIHATCRTSVHQLAGLVRSHTLVNVQGAGSRHSGRYYVTGVKHLISPVSHVMEVELARNAWGNEEGGGQGGLNAIF